MKRKFQTVSETDKIGGGKLSTHSSVHKNLDRKQKHFHVEDSLPHYVENCFRLKFFGTERRTLT